MLILLVSSKIYLYNKIIIGRQTLYSRETRYSYLEIKLKIIISLLIYLLNYIRVIDLSCTLTEGQTASHY